MWRAGTVNKYEFFYHTRMLKYGQAYVDQGMEHYEAKYRRNQIKWLAKSAAALNLQLTPLTEVAV